MAVCILTAATAAPGASADGAAAAGTHAAAVGPAWNCPLKHYYTGVDAWAPDEGWVVGSRRPDCHYYGLIQRWDGDDWTTVPSPQPGDPTTSCGVHLYAVDAVSADDAWAVGEYCRAYTENGARSLIEEPVKSSV